MSRFIFQLMEFVLNNTVQMLELSYVTTQKFLMDGRFSIKDLSRLNYLEKQSSELTLSFGMVQLESLNFLILLVEVKVS